MGNLYLYFGIYIIFLIAIALFVSLKENKEDFLISGRDRKWWTIMASKFAGAIGMGWLITYSGYAYKYGLGVYIVIIGFIVGYAFFAFWIVPKIFKISRNNKFYTQGDLVFYNLKNKLSRNITNYISVIVQFTWLLVSIIGGAKIIDSLGIMSYELALIFTLITVFIYIIIAGYKAVLITDIFQSIIIFILLFILSFYIVGDENIFEIIKIVPGQLSVSSIIGFFLYGTFSFLAMSDRYQLVYASKTEKDIKRGIFFTFIPLCITAVFIILIGLFIYSKNPNLDADMVFLHAITNYLPQSLLSIGVVLLFAGLMSSADTQIYAISSHIVLNKHSEKKPVKKIRLVIFILLIITGIISFFFRDIIGVTIISAGLSLILSIPMIYIIKGGKNKNRFLSSVFGSIIGFLLGIGILGLDPSAAIVVLIGGIIGLIKK